MAVCGIHYHNVNFRFHKLSRAIQAIRRDAQRRAAEKTSLGVFCGKRILDLLLNIFNCNKAFQVALVIHDRELLFSGFGQDLLRLFERDPLLRRDQAFGSHGFFDLLREVFFKFQITVRNDADKFASFCNRYA